MKTQLNYKECSFILNKSEDYCISLIKKELGLTITFDSKLYFVRNKGNADIHTPREFKKEALSWKVGVDRLAEITQVNIAALITDINNNFFRNEVCVEYLLKKVESKYKPNSKTGAFPLSIKIPEEVTCFMNEANIQTAIRLLSERVSDKVIYKV